MASVFRTEVSNAYLLFMSFPSVQTFNTNKPLKWGCPKTIANKPQSEEQKLPMVLVQQLQNGIKANTINKEVNNLGDSLLQ